ncbi:MAG: 3-deoxy-D-manno-octulosonic acid transferase [Rhodobacteraceae bacterium]|nr:3-deoxy-D-manno-octulosonic acid transferase [Paracoccaceae bacterium]
MLTLYRIAALLWAPFLIAKTLFHPRYRRPGALGQRFGRSRAEASGPVLWLHGASNGELTSARALIEQLLSDHPALHILITAHTPTGYDLARGWNINRTSVRLAPYDIAPAIRAILRRWQPIAHITVENEAWPNRILTCRAAGIPCWFVGARLSERSHAGWKRRAPGLARRVFAALDRVYPQDAQSGLRFIDLGVDPDRIGTVENLKSSVRPAPLPSDFTTLSEIFKRDRTVFAASTHPGEEEVVLTAFARARTRLPGLRLILAPRHTHRAEEVAELIESSGIAFTRRSTGDLPGPLTPIYLADSMGEMTAWYRLSGVTFVGGTLVDHGGHTPYEPALEGSAIAHGPHVSNQQDAFAALTRANAALPVTNADELARAFQTLAKPATIRTLANAAEGALFTGNEGRTSREISGLIAPYVR